MNVQNAEFLRLHVASGWHQARTARELALEPSTVSRYLSNQAVPSLTVLRLFAGLLGERLALPGETESASTLRDGPRWLESWESDLVSVLRRVDPAARPRVIGALREIVEAIGGASRYPRPSPGARDPVPTTDEILDAAQRAVRRQSAGARPGASAAPSGATPRPSDSALESPPDASSDTPRTASRAGRRPHGPRSSA